MTTVTVLVPAYNEETTIVELLRRVNAQAIDGVDFDIVVIDDGSADRTLELLESNPDLYTTLIKLPRNGGKGAAVMAGLAAATGEFVLFQDAGRQPGHRSCSCSTTPPSPTSIPQLQIELCTPTAVELQPSGPDFGDWAVFGSPFRKFSRHPVPSFLRRRRSGWQIINQAQDFLKQAGTATSANC